MTVSHRYIYGFARAADAQAIAEPGIGDPGAPVEIVSRAGLAALVSEAPAGDVTADRRNLAARRDELAGLLGEVEGRGEHRLTAYYDQDLVLAEIVADDPEVARLRKETQGVSPDAGYYMRIRLGELVLEAMRRKRTHDEAHVLDRLRPLAGAFTRQEELPEAVVLKASFLVERGREEEFDRAVQELAREADGRMRFKRVGPLPPYSFVDVHLPAANGARASWAS